MDQASSLKEIAFKFALKNASDFGKASVGAVSGKVISEFADAKKDMKTAMQAISLAVSQVNALSKEQVAQELSKYSFQEKPNKEEKEKTLPELDGAAEGNVVMRMAPNPNGPLHIGHTRMAILNDEYAKKYKGTLFLRFDDTDPKNETKLPMKEAYLWDQEDLQWLGVKFHKFFTASSRLQVYYEYFEKLLQKENAYVCTCQPEEWKKLVRFERKPCPCRSLPAQDQLERWKKMLSWEYKQGSAVARVKTPLDLPNPAVVDWPAFRIVDSPQHPLAPKEARVWPLLDFAGSIDDHDYEVTHILRGKDLVDSENRQRELYKHFGWTYPHTTVYGKFLAEDFVLSKSKILTGIKEQVYSGWDDPKLPTLRAFKRRGIKPEAIRKFILDLGISQHEVNADLDILYAENRKLLDEQAARFFFAEQPTSLLLESGQEFSAEIKNHPSNQSLGTRIYQVQSGTTEFEICGKDAEALKEGDEFRLKELCLAKVIEKNQAGMRALKIADAGSRVKIIHWVQKSRSVAAKILLDTGETKLGVCEDFCAKLELGTIIQFERMFFCKLDSKNQDASELTFYFTHN